MTRITTAICPRCGAQLQPVPGNPQATCAYCGTTSFVEQQRTHAGLPRVPVKSSAPLIIGVLGVGALVLLGATVSVLMLTGGPEPTNVVATNAPTAVLPTPQVAPEAIDSPNAIAHAPPIEILTSLKPQLTDVDGDGADDVVVMLSTSGSGSTEHYAAFSARTGRELSRTPAIADRNETVTVAGRRLIAGSRSGQLTSYGLASGSQQWTTALGARVTTFCAAKSSDALLVRTDEQRTLAVDLTTGRQSETKEPCTVILTPGDRNDPRDRHDYSAPRGTESYHCGGVTVMGSENYTVADQCLARAHVDTERLHGLNGSRLWKIEQNWLVLGIRKPGTRVPMVGLVVRGKLAWKSEIPRDNPLEAEEGAPQHVGLSGPLVVAAFSTSKDRHPFVTAFTATDGIRRWTVPLTDRSVSVSSLVTSASHVFVQADKQLFILDASTGKAVAELGTAR